jgi:hypothetical protein
MHEPHAQSNFLKPFRAFDSGRQQEIANPVFRVHDQFIFYLFAFLIARSHGLMNDRGETGGGRPDSRADPAMMTITSTLRMALLCESLYLVSSAVR